MKKHILLSVGLLLFAGIILHAQSKPGLYVGEAFQGEMDLYDSLDWIAANAQDGGEYSIVLGASIAASSSVLDYSGKSVTVSLKSSGDTLQVSYATRSPTSSLFTVKSSVTFVLENGVELVGRPSASRPPVTVDGGNFIMNGGAVKDSNVDHSSNWFGGGVDVLHGGSFTMNDGIISRNACTGGAGVNVGENTTFTMNGGLISGNNGTGKGGGVYVAKNATFTMNGGLISGNNGGGVYVRNTFTLNDGTISSNYSNGVYVYGGGTFVMQGGAVRNNSGRGIYIDDEIAIVNGKRKTIGGTFTMYSGVVADNGGGVYMKRGLFTMNGGIISGNTASSGGGVYAIDYSSVVMNDGFIIKNTANYEGGGGVYVSNATSFTMNGGSISENIAAGESAGGGGVHIGNSGLVTKSGLFTMNGGVIERNIANSYTLGGGGVLVGGPFAMNDGTISGNYAANAGGGVLVMANSTFVKSNTAGVIYGGDAAEDKANKADQYGHAVHTKNGSRDTTARATMALDSRKYGAEGGWE